MRLLLRLLEKQRKKEEADAARRAAEERMKAALFKGVSTFHVAGSSFRDVAIEGCFSQPSTSTSPVQILCWAVLHAFKGSKKNSLLYSQAL